MVRSHNAEPITLSNFLFHSAQSHDMPRTQANCSYCGKPFQIGWERNRHMKQCIQLSADTDDVLFPDIIEDHEVRNADGMALEQLEQPEVAVRLEEENADSSNELHVEDDEGAPVVRTEHKHKWRLSPKILDIIRFLGATSRGLPMPEANVNTMLHYVKSLPDRAANNLPKTSKTAWRNLTTVSYICICIEPYMYITYTYSVYYMYLVCT